LPLGGSKSGLLTYSKDKGFAPECHSKTLIIQYLLSIQAAKIARIAWYETCSA